jgi:hypothetical protein
MAGSRSGALGILTTKGDVLGVDANGNLVRVPVGADGDQLSADSAATSGLSWGPGASVQAAIPVETDDSAAGFKIGSRVYSTSARAWYTASDVTAGAAQWLRSPNVGRQIRIWEPQAGSTQSVVGWSVVASSGTISVPAPATTNLHTSMARTRIVSSVAANSNSAAAFGGNGAGSPVAFLRGTAPQGGFYAHSVFGVNSTTALQRCFLGLWSNGGIFGGAQDPDALTDCFGVGWRSADGNLQVFHNDNAGTVTAIDLGASFPANDTTAVYEVILYAAPGEAVVRYIVRRLDSFALAVGAPAANLPTAGTFMQFHCGMNNGGTAAAVEIEHMRTYAET